ncbi:hypothetical protein BB560_000388 [Smittium megazygosporum]|uniref:Vacuolar membrane-associated protein IML1 n=1 Tax=Smittium megazygosporum TaxID=133381 RepID=A0A2T9ZKE9_9FUNG|nr:hypothetical protein BB560_000388 [Smittium megazygosporum]
MRRRREHTIFFKKTSIKKNSTSSKEEDLASSQKSENSENVEIQPLKMEKPDKNSPASQALQEPRRTKSERINVLFSTIDTLPISGNENVKRADNTAFVLEINNLIHKENSKNEESRKPTKGPYLIEKECPLRTHSTALSNSELLVNPTYFPLLKKGDVVAIKLISSHTENKGLNDDHVLLSKATEDRDIESHQRSKNLSFSKLEHKKEQGRADKKFSIFNMSKKPHLSSTENPSPEVSETSSKYKIRSETKPLRSHFDNRENNNFNSSKATQPVGNEVRVEFSANTAPGNILKIFPDPSREIYLIVGELKSDLGQTQVSILNSTAQTAWGSNLSKMKMVISKVDITNPIVVNAIKADYVEISFRDQYQERSGLWKLWKMLKHSIVHNTQSIAIQNTFRATVRRIYKNNTLVASGYIDETTLPLFRSESSRFTLMIQVSAETREFEDDGEIMATKVTNFLFELFSNWGYYRVNHTVTIVLFSRVIYDSDSVKLLDSVEWCPDLEIYHNDYYKVLTYLESRQNWKSIIPLISSEIKNYSKNVLEFELPSKKRIILGKLSRARQGNILQSINMSLNSFLCNRIDRDLVRSGNSLVIVSPSNGVFDVNRDLLRVTSERLLHIGFRPELVCLAKKPMFTAPVFRFRSYIVPSEQDLLMALQLERENMFGVNVPESKLQRNAHVPIVKIDPATLDPLYFDFPYWETKLYNYYVSLNSRVSHSMSKNDLTPPEVSFEKGTFSKSRRESDHNPHYITPGSFESDTQLFECQILSDKKSSTYSLKATYCYFPFWIRCGFYETGVEKPYSFGKFSPVFKIGKLNNTGIADFMISQPQVDDIRFHDYGFSDQLARLYESTEQDEVSNESFGDIKRRFLEACNSYDTAIFMNLKRTNKSLLPGEAQIALKTLSMFQENKNKSAVSLDQNSEIRSESSTMGAYKDLFALNFYDKSDDQPAPHFQGLNRKSGATGIHLKKTKSGNLINTLAANYSNDDGQPDLISGRIISSLNQGQTVKTHLSNLKKIISVNDNNKHSSVSSVDLTQIEKADNPQSSSPNLKDRIDLSSAGSENRTSEYNLDNTLEGTHKGSESTLPRIQPAIKNPLGKPDFKAPVPQVSQLEAAKINGSELEKDKGYKNKMGPEEGNNSSSVAPEYKSVVSNHINKPNFGDTSYKSKENVETAKLSSENNLLIQGLSTGLENNTETKKSSEMLKRNDNVLFSLPDYSDSDMKSNFTSNNSVSPRRLDLEFSNEPSTKSHKRSNSEEIGSKNLLAQEIYGSSQNFSSDSSRKFGPNKYDEENLVFDQNNRGKVEKMDILNKDFDSGSFQFQISSSLPTYGIVDTFLAQNIQEAQSVGLRKSQLLSIRPMRDKKRGSMYVTAKTDESKLLKSNANSRQKNLRFIESDGLATRSATLKNNTEVQSGPMEGKVDSPNVPDNKNNIKIQDGSSMYTQNKPKDQSEFGTLDINDVKNLQENAAAQPSINDKKEGENNHTDVSRKSISIDSYLYSANGKPSPTNSVLKSSKGGLYTKKIDRKLLFFDELYRKGKKQLLIKKKSETGINLKPGGNYVIYPKEFPTLPYLLYQKSKEYSLVPFANLDGRNDYEKSKMPLYKHKKDGLAPSSSFVYLQTFSSNATSKLPDNSNLFFTNSLNNGSMQPSNLASSIPEELPFKNKKYGAYIAFDPCNPDSTHIAPSIFSRRWEFSDPSNTPIKNTNLKWVSLCMPLFLPLYFSQQSQDLNKFFKKYSYSVNIPENFSRSIDSEESHFENSGDKSPTRSRFFDFTSQRPKKNTSTLNKSLESDRISVFIDHLICQRLDRGYQIILPVNISSQLFLHNTRIDKNTVNLGNQFANATETNQALGAAIFSSVNAFSLHSRASARDPLDSKSPSKNIGFVRKTDSENAKLSTVSATLPSSSHLGYEHLETIPEVSDKGSGLEDEKQMEKNGANITKGKQRSFSSLVKMKNMSSFSNSSNDSKLSKKTILGLELKTSDKTFKGDHLSIELDSSKDLKKKKIELHYGKDFHNHPSSARILTPARISKAISESDRHSTISYTKVKSDSIPKDADPVTTSFSISNDSSSNTICLTNGREVQFISTPINSNSSFSQQPIVNITRYEWDFQNNNSAIEYKYMMWSSSNDTGYIKSKTMFHDKVDQFFNWNSLDHLIAGNSFGINDDLKYTRTRYILIPMETLPTDAHENGETPYHLNEEEIRIASFEKFLDLIFKFLHASEKKRIIKKQQKSMDSHMAYSILENLSLNNLDNAKGKISSHTDNIRQKINSPSTGEQKHLHNSVATKTPSLSLIPSTFYDEKYFSKRVLHQNGMKHTDNAAAGAAAPELHAPKKHNEKHFLSSDLPGYRPENYNSLAQDTSGLSSHASSQGFIYGKSGIEEIDELSRSSVSGFSKNSNLKLDLKSRIRDNNVLEKSTKLSNLSSSVLSSNMVSSKVFDINYTTLFPIAYTNWRFELYILKKIGNNNQPPTRPPLTAKYLIQKIRSLSPLDLGDNLSLSLYSPFELLGFCLQHPIVGLQLSNYKWHSMNYLNVFTGTQLVNWILNNIDGISTRKQAVDVGNRFLERRLIAHCARGLPFLDGHYLYTLTPAAKSIYSIEELLLSLSNNARKLRARKNFTDQTNYADTINSDTVGLEERGDVRYSSNKLNHLRVDHPLQYKLSNEEILAHELFDEKFNAYNSTSERRSIDINSKLHPPKSGSKDERLSISTSFVSRNFDSTIESKIEERRRNLNSMENNLIKEIENTFAKVKLTKTITTGPNEGVRKYDIPAKSRNKAKNRENSNVTTDESAASDTLKLNIGSLRRNSYPLNSQLDISSDIRRNRNSNYKKQNNLDHGPTPPSATLISLAKDSSLSAKNINKNPDSKVKRPTSYQRRKIPEEIKPLEIESKKTFELDLDPQKKSNQPENALLYIDSVQNPQTCFHFSLNWLNCSPRLIYELIHTWSLFAKRCGMKLVEVPISKNTSPGSMDPYYSSKQIKLSLLPPPAKKVFLVDQKNTEKSCCNDTDKVKKDKELSYDLGNLHTNDLTGPKEAPTEQIDSSLEDNIFRGANEHAFSDKSNDEKLRNVLSLAAKVRPGLYEYIYEEQANKINGELAQYLTGFPSFLFEREFLFAHGFVLDVEASTSFPDSSLVHMVYPFDKGDITHPQFVHKSGTVFAKIIAPGKFVWISNYLYSSNPHNIRAGVGMNSSLKESQNSSKNLVSNHIQRGKGSGPFETVPSAPNFKYTSSHNSTFASKKYTNLSSSDYVGKVNSAKSSRADKYIIRDNFKKNSDILAISGIDTNDVSIKLSSNLTSVDSKEFSIIPKSECRLLQNSPYKPLPEPVLKIQGSLPSQTKDITSSGTFENHPNAPKDFADANKRYRSLGGHTNQNLIEGTPRKNSIGTSDIIKENNTVNNGNNGEVDPESYTNKKENSGLIFSDRKQKRIHPKLLPHQYINLYIEKDKNNIRQYNLDLSMENASNTLIPMIIDQKIKSNSYLSEDNGYQSSSSDQLNDDDLQFAPSNSIINKPTIDSNRPKKQGHILNYKEAQKPFMSDKSMSNQGLNGPCLSDSNENNQQRLHLNSLNRPGLKTDNHVCNNPNCPNREHMISSNSSKIDLVSNKNERSTHSKNQNFDISFNIPGINKVYKISQSSKMASEILSQSSHYMPVDSNVLLKQFQLLCNDKDYLEYFYDYALSSFKAQLYNSTKGIRSSSQIKHSVPKLVPFSHTPLLVNQLSFDSWDKFGETKEF